jgi:hypothetical protein
MTRNIIIHLKKHTISENAIRAMNVLICLAIPENRLKMSTFFNVYQHGGRMNAEMASGILPSPWVQQEQQTDTQEDWEDVQTILNQYVSVSPLYEVIASSLMDISSNHLHYDQETNYYEKIITALFSHPLFVNFWQTVQSVHGPQAFRENMKKVMRFRCHDTYMISKITLLLG